MVNRFLPNVWWSRALWIVATYVVATDFLPNVLLIVVGCVGYLPYSDRPGPGWQTAHLPTSEEIRFFAGFAWLLLPSSAVYGLTFSAAAMALGFCVMPRWGLRIAAAPLAFVASGLMMAAAGWLIAISSVGIYIAAGCGALWGLLAFPRLVPRMSRTLPKALRLALPVVLLTGGTYWLLRPLLPDPGLTNAKIEVIRRAEREADLASLDLSYLGPSIALEAKGVGKYASASRMDFRTDGRNQVRVLLIVDDAHLIANTFVLPRTGDAIYRQSDGRWRQERKGSGISKLSLKLNSQGSDGIDLQVLGPCCSTMTQTHSR
jgi:hypothetical protein